MLPGGWGPPGCAAARREAGQARCCLVGSVSSKESQAVALLTPVMAHGMRRWGTPCWRPLEVTWRVLAGQGWQAQGGGAYLCWWVSWCAFARRSLCRWSRRGAGAAGAWFWRGASRVSCRVRPIDL